MSSLGYSRMEQILIIGGTGNVGHEVITQLTASGRHIRALARKPGHSSFCRQKWKSWAGISPSCESLDKCLDGIDTVFLVWTAPSNARRTRLGHDCKACPADRIPFSSTQNTAPILSTTQSIQSASRTDGTADRETSGLQWTFLRPGIFAANALNWWGPADSCRRGGALAVSRRSDSPDSRA